MRQSCAVDLVGFDVCDLAFDRFCTECPKPDRGLVGRLHVSLVLPQAHREHLAFLRVAEEQTAAVAGLHPEGRDEVLFDRTLPLLQALRAYFVLAYPREHVTTAFLVHHTDSAIKAACEEVRPLRKLSALQHFSHKKANLTCSPLPALSLSREPLRPCGDTFGV